jgi:hypothetical protein
LRCLRNTNPNRHTRWRAWYVYRMFK